MKGCGRHLLLLGVVALLLLLEEAAGSSSSHSLRNFRLMVSEPNPGLTSFTVVAYVDDQPIIHYDSHTRRMRPLAPWMRKVEQDEPRFWDEESQVLQGDEKLFRQSLATLLDHFHHHSSTRLHTLQLMISCEVWPDGRPGEGLYQYAYDGRDIIVFDKETSTWVVFAPQAKILKKKLHSLLAYPEHVKAYLEKTCLDWLHKYLEYGNEILLRTESPMVRVACNKGKDGWGNLTCRVYGFYPKEIEVTWMKDGEDRKPETLTGGVLPNSDGTYHTWLSIGVDSMDRDHYRCRVEHSSLPGPQEWWWEELGDRLRRKESSERIQLGIFLCLSAALILLEFITFPRSKLRLILIILVCILAAAILLEIFLFPTSKRGLLLSFVGCLLADLILVGIIIVRALSSVLNLRGLLWGIAGGFAAVTLLCIPIFLGFNTAFVVGIFNSFIAAFLLLRVTVFLVRRRMRR